MMNTFLAMSIFPKQVKMIKEIQDIVNYFFGLKINSNCTEKELKKFENHSLKEIVPG